MLPGYDRISRGTISRAVRVLGAAVLWLVVWQLLYQNVGQEIPLISPVQILPCVFELLGQAGFRIFAGASLYNVAAGFVCASLLGTMLGALCYRFRPLYQLIYPLFSAVKVTSVTLSIIPVLAWLQSVRVPAFIAGLIVLPIVFGNVRQDVATANRELLEIACVFRPGRWKALRYTYLPTVVPYLTAAFTTGIGLAWRAGMSAEALANMRNSIGGRIYGAKIYLDTADLFAWTAVVIVPSVVLEWLLLACFRRIP